MGPITLGMVHLQSHATEQIEHILHFRNQTQKRFYHIRQGCVLCLAKKRVEINRDSGPVTGKFFIIPFARNVDSTFYVILRGFSKI